MQTALHILALTGEIKQQLVDATISHTEFYKKERAAYFFFKKKGQSLTALGFVYHPAGSGAFVVPASKINVDTREKPWPIFDINGANVAGVEQIGLDRLFRIKISKDGKNYDILFEALGVNGNVWLLDDTGAKLKTLRHRKYTEGDKYEPPPPLDKLNPFKITPAALNTCREEHTTKSVSCVFYIEKNILAFNRTMAVETVHRAGLEFVETETLEDEGLGSLAAVITDLAGRFQNPDSGYLYAIHGKHEVYPFKLKSKEDQPEKFKSLSLAVMALVERKQSEIEEATEEKRILEIVGRAVKRIKNRLPKIQDDITEAEHYEDYKKIGELLQIHIGEIKKGQDKIVLEDIYNDNRLIDIKLEPAHSPNENIQDYFKKYRKGREGLELLKRRLKITREELATLEKMKADLENSFERAFEKYESDILSLMPREARKGETTERLPYREYQLSTGLIIFVGRDGADNDRTTFEFARPYEMWFHAQQCPGSHVVIKYPNKSFEPSLSEIAETAAIAAWHSKAKNDSMVPVVYTQRKYVRKPRKAKPGLVTVEREKSIMVTPRKPE